MYDAFVSYSHAKDRDIAGALQGSIQTLGKAWWQRRKLRVFRDETSLTASPGLWAELEKKLTSSKYLVLMASPEAAASPWVDKEIATWLRHYGKEAGTAKILIALTAGDLRWNGATSDFVWDESTPLPPSMRGQFSDEPFWVDLRAYRADSVNAHKGNKDFAARTGKIAARVLGVPLEDLLSAELLQQKRALRLAWGATLSVLALLGVAVWQWRTASSAELQARRTLAVGDQQRAVELFTRSGETDESMRKPGRALAYLAHAIRAYPSDSFAGRRAISQIAEYPFVIPALKTGVSQLFKLQDSSGALGRATPAGKVYLSPNGVWSVRLSKEIEISSPETNKEWTRVQVRRDATTDYDQVAFSRSGRFAVIVGGHLNEIGGYSEINFVFPNVRASGRRLFWNERIINVSISNDGRLAFVSLENTTSVGNARPGVKTARIVILGVLTYESSDYLELSELGSIADQRGEIRASADGEFLQINNLAYRLARVIREEPLNDPGSWPAHIIGFSRDGTRILASKDEPQNGREINVFDLRSNERLTPSPPVLSSIRHRFSGELSPAGLSVERQGKPICAIKDRDIVFAAIDIDGTRLATARADGSVWEFEVECSNEGRRLTGVDAIYGNPWSSFWPVFVTAAGSEVRQWVRIAMKEGLKAVEQDKMFSSMKHDFSANETDVALHPSGRLVAIGSMGNKVASVRIIDVRSGLDAVDEIALPSGYNSESVNPAFSRDGRSLYVFWRGIDDAPGGLQIRETETGLPVTRWQPVSGDFFERPDGRQLLNTGYKGGPSTFDLLGGNGPVPLWVAELAEAVSGLRIDDRNVVVTLGWDERQRMLETVKSAVRQSRKDDRWAEFGVWYLSDEPDYLISPYSATRVGQTKRR